MSRVLGNALRGLRRPGSSRNFANCDGPGNGKDPCATQCPPPPCPSDQPECPPPPPTPICPINSELESKVKLWKRISLLGCVPSVLIMILITMLNREEEKRQPRPEYKPWDYMYKRNKRFPWGDGNHGFFHNPERNPVPPHGYEAPDPFQE